MQPHTLAEIFWTKLVRFGQIWLDLGEIHANLRRNLSRSD